LPEERVKGLAEQIINSLTSLGFMRGCPGTGLAQDRYYLLVFFDAGLKVNDNIRSIFQS
jgi:hypothetical protein